MASAPVRNCQAIKHQVGGWGDTSAHDWPEIKVVVVAVDPLIVYQLRWWVWQGRPLLGNHPHLFRTEVDAEGVWLHKALPITIAMVLDVARAFTILHHIHLTTACLCGHLPIS